MPTIVTVTEPRAEDRDAILQPLIAHGQKVATPSNYREVALRLSVDGTAGTGGLYAKIFYEWMFVELLAIPEHLRGNDLGTALMLEAERIAREAGCRGIWLDTFEFQAPAFYEKLGYARFGAIDDHPRGMQRIFYKKTL